MNRNTIPTLCALALCAGSVPAFAEEFDMWVRSDGEGFLPAIVEAFNERSEHEVTLQIVPATELVQKYGISAAGGSAPEALSLDLIFTPSFAAAGQLEDMTDFAESLPYFEHLSPGHLAVGTHEGRIYGLPYSADSSVLLINKELYRRAGLDPESPPTTWDEIREHAEAIDALGDDVHGFYFAGSCPGCNAFTMLPLVWASGGEVLSEDGSSASFDSETVREAMAFHNAMVADGLVPAGAQTDTGAGFVSSFANGNIGIQGLGAFAIGLLNRDYPDLDYGVSLLPGRDGGTASFAGGDNFVVTAGTSEAKLEAIKAFLEFSYSLEGQRLLASTGGSLPVRGDVAEAALEGLDERYLVTAEAMAVGRTPASTVYNDIFNSSNGPWNSAIGRAAFGPADGIEATLESAQKAVQSIVDGAN